MKIVRPTILQPWRERIEATATVEQVVRVLEDLCAFRVLDPACGCGNFLYVAYRELRSLELELKERIIRIARQTGAMAPHRDDLPYYPLKNLYGIDIEPIAVLIARVTLWMGQRQMIDRFGPAEPALPLVDLSGIQAGDALAQPWPDSDCIIGNPPFLGSQHVRRSRGDQYVAWLKTTFGVGVKDYCVYWFRKAHDRLRAGQRAGLVGTNSVSQNRARGASLEYILANNGVITDAVSTQKWPGDAKVHVSIVNWVKGPATAVEKFTLDGVAVSGITAELRTPERSTGEVPILKANKGHCFEGPIPGNAGFILEDAEARVLLARSDAPYRDVVRPYLDSDDLTEDPAQQARRWAIDFGSMPLEAAMRYPAALSIVRERVKPERDANRDKGFRELWWRFGRPRPAMRAALNGLPRYVAGIRHGKRALFAWCEPWTMASDATVVLAFGDDYSMGVLCSRAHGAWAWSRGSTWKGDLRYTPSSVFEKFPWPSDVADERRAAVAAACRAVIARRQEICVQHGVGLTALYNMADEGAFVDLTRMHRELDEAVAAAYDWPKAIAQDDDELVRRLFALNAEIASGTRPYEPFASDVGGQMRLLSH